MSRDILIGALLLFGTLLTLVLVWSATLLMGQYVPSDHHELAFAQNPTTSPRGLVEDPRMAPVIQLEDPASVSFVNVDLTDLVKLPLFKGTTPDDDRVAQQINTVLQSELLEGETITNWKVSEASEPMQHNPAFLDYKISYPTPQILTVFTTGEVCGAYCTGFELGYTFELKTGRLLTPKDVFTESGLRTLLQEMATKKKDDIAAFVENAKIALPLAKDNDERAMLQWQIEMYPECFMNDYDSSEYVFEKGDVYNWIYSATSTTIIDYPCFNHATQAWDELGQLAFTKEFGAITDLLTPLGKKLFLGLE